MATSHVSFGDEGQLSPYIEKWIIHNTIFFLLDEFAYTFDIYSAPIFPDDKSKDYILTEHNQAVYNISHLSFGTMDHTINASDVQIHVEPAILDDTRTRLDIQIYAAAADVTGQWMSKGYNKLEIKSLYGIHDRTTDKMIAHVPYNAVFFLLVE